MAKKPPAKPRAKKAATLPVAAKAVAAGALLDFDALKLVVTTNNEGLNKHPGIAGHLQLVADELNKQPTIKAALVLLAAQSQIPVTTIPAKTDDDLV